MASTRRKSSTVATASWKYHKPSNPLRQPFDHASYPRISGSFIGAIHDLRRANGLLENPNNFAPTTKAVVYEAAFTKPLQIRLLDESSDLEYLRIRKLIKNLSKKTQGYASCNTAVPSKMTFSDIESFCYLKSVPSSQNADFRCQLTVSAQFAKQLLATFDVIPQFCGALLGEPDYGAPGDFATFDRSGQIEKIEFCCQQPRWSIHSKLTPWCIYMTHSFKTNATTYIICCDEQQNRLNVVKERLSDILDANFPDWISLRESLNPFFLHLLITHEVFLEAVPEITKLRHQLYSALDKVDRYAAKIESEREKSELEDLTIKLHIVSQETDRMFANVGMSSMILQRMIRAHDRYCGSVSSDASKKDSVVKMDDALQYMYETIESQQRWLASYKLRKDIAMNLVFNLVTQQDSSTSTTIAREAKADGSAMRTIATLTMAFLPGTFVASIFSMPILAQASWIHYVAVTLPLTLFVFVTWWIWQNMELWKHGWQTFQRRTT